MCAQAALCSLARYWHNRTGGQMFSRLYAPDISTAAGVLKSNFDQSAKRGLSSREIAQYMAEEGVAAETFPFVHLPASLVDEEHPERLIYSFMESGMPVMGVIKTARGYHAVVFIGHTFDKNAWDAAADIGYYAQVGSGLGGKYHSNISWIRHFVVHDDNFGPFSFFPVDKLTDVIATLWVVLPSSQIKERDPLNIERAAFKVTQSLISNYKEAFQKNLIANSNHFWVQQFLKHAQLNSGNGIVLRTFLLQGEDIAEGYRGHELSRRYSARYKRQNKEKWFWVTEISWPNIYCLQQHKCGEVVTDASTGEILSVHLPGLLFMQYATGSLTIHFCDREDIPRPHFKPAVE